MISLMNLSIFILCALALVVQCAPPPPTRDWIIQVDNAESVQNVKNWYKNNGLPDAKLETIQIYNLTILAMPSAGEDPDSRKSLSNVKGVDTVWPECQWKTSQFIKALNPPVGLDELDGLIDGVFNLPTDARGQGTTVYVVDTGCDVEHEQIKGRAEIKDFTGEGNRDDNGHGTHVGGTVAGNTVGVAREAKLKCMKVFGASGSGSNRLILRALQDISRTASGPSVVNLSLGGPRNNGDTITENVINALVQQGIAVVVAAGNEGQNSCNTSPAFIKTAITVGAIDPRTSRIAGFSNFGTCNTLFAPGVRVVSAAANRGSGLTTLSGTSMASPHVAGIMAAFMSTGLTNEQARLEMLRIAAQGSVEGNLRGTANINARFN